MGSTRNWLGLALLAVCVAPGCANLIGLSDYGVGGAASESHAGAQSIAGSSGDAGAGDAGAGDAGGDAGSSAAGSGGGLAGNAGAAGAAGGSVCTAGCDDANECTDDACVGGKCVHQPIGIGADCGVGQSCDAQGLCVRCRDTAPGAAQDTGCPATAPVCIGTGADAVCGGCTKDQDCADSNDCTTEKCTEQKCVISAVAAGDMCASGVCNGAAPEKCVACADTALGGARDAGCSAAKPVCDATGTGTCYACVKDEDCASDGVSCTVDTCTNHACTHVATDSQCMPSGDACKPNKCDAVADCKQVDISVANTLMNDDPNVGNGSFENGMNMGNAVGWSNTGTDAAIIWDCTGTAVPANGGCKGSVGTAFQDDGNLLAWFGGTTYAAVDQVEHQLALPAGTTTLLIQADLNAQTVSTAAGNKDSFDVLLLDAAKVQIGLPVYTATNVTAQTSAPKWTSNAVNKTVDVSAQAGKKIFLRLRSNVDATLKTDFFVDNVRVVATVCQ